MNKWNALTTLVILSMVGLSSPAARADMTDQEYIAALKIAQQKIERERAARETHENGANALSSSLLTKLMGRYYRVGDKWKVAAWNLDNPAMRRTEERHLLQPKPRRGGI